MTPELLVYCARHHSDSHAAEDVVGSVFEVAWRRWDSLPSDDSGRRAWVYEATKHVLRSQRGLSVRRARLVAALRPATSGSSPAPDDAVVARERVERALDQLPPEQAAALRCVTLQGLDSRQTAQALGISITAVTSRINRARPALRRLLTAWEEDDHAT